MRMVSKLGKKMSRRHERLEIFTPRTTAHRVHHWQLYFWGGLFFWFPGLECYCSEDARASAARDEIQADRGGIVPNVKNAIDPSAASHAAD